MSVTHSNTAKFLSSPQLERRQNPCLDRIDHLPAQLCSVTMIRSQEKFVKFFTISIWLMIPIRKFMESGSPTRGYRFIATRHESGTLIGKVGRTVLRPAQPEPKGRYRPRSRPRNRSAARRSSTRTRTTICVRTTNLRENGRLSDI